MSKNNFISEPAYMHEKGPLAFKLVNDYLFREMLQKNNKVLKALIASLLHLERSEIESVVITNPIMLADNVEGKDCVLDIAVVLNNYTIIDLEMQVNNYGNWVERSISYLCRCANNVEKGEDYNTLHPAIQIGILDYTLFQDRPEFYANYYLMNEKNLHRYSDKIRLSVLDLNQIDLATEEDKQYKIDYWARLFKSTTWEELKMLAQNDEVMAEAVSTIYGITQDSEAVWRLRAREERLARERRDAEQMKHLLKRKEQLQVENEQLQEQSEQLQMQNEQMQMQNEQLRKQLHAMVIYSLQSMSPEEVASQFGIELVEVHAIANGK